MCLSEHYPRQEWTVELTPEQIKRPGRGAGPSEQAIHAAEVAAGPVPDGDGRQLMIYVTFRFVKTIDQQMEEHDALMQAQLSALTQMIKRRVERSMDLAASATGGAVVNKGIVTPDQLDNPRNLIAKNRYEIAFVPLTEVRHHHIAQAFGQPKDFLSFVSGNRAFQRVDLWQLLQGESELFHVCVIAASSSTLHHTYKSNKHYGSLFEFLFLFDNELTFCMQT